jgi:hypothetical protein
MVGHRARSFSKSEEGDDPRKDVENVGKPQKDRKYRFGDNGIWNPMTDSGWNSRKSFWIVWMALIRKWSTFGRATMRYMDFHLVEKDGTDLHYRLSKSKTRKSVNSTSSKKSV